MSSDSIKEIWDKICSKKAEGVGYPIFVGADPSKPVARLSNSGTAASPLPSIYVRLETLKPDGLKNESFRGFSVQVESGVFGADDATQTYAIINCSDNPYSDIFLTFSERLLVKLTENVSASAAVKQMIQEWIGFFKRTGLEPLELEEITGLFGELYVLKGLIGQYGARKKLLSSWHGPKGANWDFVLSDILGRKVITEVKTTIRPRTIITVNGMDQMSMRPDFDCWLYFLSVDYLENTTKKLDGTIVELVAEVRASFSHTPDGNLSADFDELLEMVGYFQVHEEYYKKHLFNPNNSKWHKVDETFPALSRARLNSDVRDRIDRLNYRLNIAGLPEFEGPVLLKA